MPTSWQHDDGNGNGKTAATTTTNHNRNRNNNNHNIHNDNNNNRNHCNNNYGDDENNDDDGNNKQSAQRGRRGNCPARTPGQGRAAKRRLRSDPGAPHTEVHERAARRSSSVFGPSKASSRHDDRTV
jgi:hypothetical protein